MRINWQPLYYHSQIRWKSRTIKTILKRYDLRSTSWLAPRPGLSYTFVNLLCAAAILTRSINIFETIMDPVVVPIDGILDLHTFAPGELSGLLQDYIDACLESNIYDLRIIHGKGSGVMRSRVHDLLGKDWRIHGFTDAPADAGGWGATLVTLKRT